MKGKYVAALKQLKFFVWSPCLQTVRSEQEFTALLELLADQMLPQQQWFPSSILTSSFCSPVNEGWVCTPWETHRSWWLCINLARHSHKHQQAPWAKTSGWLIGLVIGISFAERSHSGMASLRWSASYRTERNYVHLQAVHFYPFVFSKRETGIAFLFLCLIHLEEWLWRT